jgi:hypothetical protein
VRRLYRPFGVKRLKDILHVIMKRQGSITTQDIRWWVVSGFSRLRKETTAVK